MTSGTITSVCRNFMQIICHMTYHTLFDVRIWSLITVNMACKAVSPYARVMKVSQITITGVTEGVTYYTITWFYISCLGHTIMTIAATATEVITVYSFPSNAGITRFMTF